MKNKNTKADLHIHTIFSKDSLLTPLKILKACKSKGIRVIAITDHNTIKGAKTVLKFSRYTCGNNDIIVIPGVELKTDYGDLILLYLDFEINTRNFYEVLDIVKENNLLTILPHPFRGHKNVEDIAKYVDLIEVKNARTPKDLNRKAYKLAGKLRKPISAGSDAHSSFEIGACYLEIPYEISNSEEIREILLKGKGIVAKGKESPFFVHTLSMLARLVNIMR